MSAAPQLENLFTELKPQPVWLPWKAVPKPDGKISKVPHNTRGVAANDRATDVTFDEVRTFLAGSNGYAGAGIHIPPGMICVDLDNCVMFKPDGSGEIAPWALKIIRALPTYCELSPNKTGLHLWMRGTKPGKACRRDSVEIYSGDDGLRFMTCTGWHVEGTPTTIEPCDVSSIYEDMVSGSLTAPVVVTSASVPTVVNESAKIQPGGKAITTRLELLMRGNIRSIKPFVIADDFQNTVEYPSQSEADGALCCLLAEKFNGDSEQIDAEFRQSSLNREKWERADYRKATIDSAIAKIKKTSMSSAAPAQPENNPADWRKQFVTVGQLQTGGVRMLVEGFLPEGISMLGALSGVGKTWLGLSLAKALTTRKPFLGRFEVKNIVPVLYLIPESNGAAFRQRAEKFHIPDDPNLFLCRTVSQGSTLLMDDPAVKAAVAELRPIVILDTAIRFNKSEDENSSSNNKMLVDDSIGLLAAGARAVLGMHHATKASAQEGLTLQNSLRGTGDLGAMCDAVYGLKRNETLYDDGNGPLQLSVVCLKPRDFDPPEPFVIAATTKDQNGQTVSFIDTTGDFALLDVAELIEDLNGRFKRMVAESPELSLGEIAEALGIKKRRAQTVADKLHYKKVKGRWQEKIKIDLTAKPIEVAV